MNAADFDATQREIKYFSEMLVSRLKGRDSKTQGAIGRGDAWGDLAKYAESDAENPELSDLESEFGDFAESMRDADNAWAEEA